jgi:SAM-dependent methyltransferase
MESSVQAHYDTPNLIHKIDAGLTAAGKHPDSLQIGDLALVDQLHTGGTRATLALAKKIPVSKDWHVLDAGCGLGGSARLLAATFGCRVTGIDLSETYIDAAKILTERTGLSSQVDFVAGSILDLPWDHPRFDMILCQHILMNIPDKPGAARQFIQVLNPGGILVLHEIVKGDHPDLALPVPWAASADISFLEPRDHVAACFTDTGFIVASFADVTDAGCRYWQKVREFAQKNAGTPRPLGPHLVFGKNADRFPFTMSQNFESRAVGLVEAVLKAP